MQDPISITTTAKQIEAILLKDGVYDVFESPVTRRARRGFLWAAAIAGMFILFASAQPNSDGLMWMAATIIIAQTIILGWSFHNLNKQRQVVLDFARSTEKAGIATLKTSDVGFSLTFKGAEHIERWANVASATIADDHIFLRALTTYIFPKASMPEDDFTSLCDIIRKYTLHDLEEESEVVEKNPIGFQRQ